MSYKLSAPIPSPTKQKGQTSPHLERLSLGPRSPIIHDFASEKLSYTEKRKKLRNQFNDMIKNLEHKCYKIIFDVFPEKIQHLDNLYKNYKEFNLATEDIAVEINFTEPTGTSEEIERKLARIEIPANKSLCDLEEILQKEILEMSEMINSLGIWVKLNRPRIADGNNFGVEVQEEITEILENAESSGYQILDSFTQYHHTRAEFVTKVLKFPGVADYKKALKELDEKTYIKTSLLACELRNDYITLYDLLAKNLDTLITPRKGEEEKLSRMY
jgi:hypothetical protein